MLLSKLWFSHILNQKRATQELRFSQQGDTLVTADIWHLNGRNFLTPMYMNIIFARILVKP